MPPLMRWRNIRGHSEAHDFDLLMARTQIARVRQSAALADCKAKVVDRVAALRINLSQVEEKLELIQRVKSDAFWTDAAVEDLEQARQGLRGIIHHRNKISGGGAESMREVDTPEDVGLIEVANRKSNIQPNDMKLYEQRVEKMLKQHFIENPVLQKIRRLEPVTEADLEQLTSLILTQHDGLDLGKLREFYAQAATLPEILRGLVGLDADTIKKRVEEFVHEHPSLNARQLRFLALLQNHIARFGVITVERLYEAPFTSVSADGFDELFADMTEDLISFIGSFQPAPGRNAQLDQPN